MASRDDLRRSMQDISEHVGESMDALFAAPPSAPSDRASELDDAATASRPRRKPPGKTRSGKGEGRAPRGDEPGASNAADSGDALGLDETPSDGTSAEAPGSPAVSAAVPAAPPPAATALVPRATGELVFAPPIPTEDDPLLDVGTYLDPEIEGELHRAAYLRGGEAEKSAIVRDALDAYLTELGQLSGDELERRLDGPRRDRTTGASRTPRTYRMRRSTKLTLLRIAGEHRVAMAALVRAALRDHLWGREGAPPSS